MTNTTAAINTTNINSITITDTNDNQLIEIANSLKEASAKSQISWTKVQETFKKNTSIVLEPKQLKNRYYLLTNNNNNNNNNTDDSSNNNTTNNIINNVSFHSNNNDTSIISLDVTTTTTEDIIIESNNEDITRLYNDTNNNNNNNVANITGNMLPLTTVQGNCTIF